MPDHDHGSTISHSDLDKYRNYLKFLARTHLSRYYHGKVDPSDIVQQSMLQALNTSDQYRGTTEQEKLAWLRKILVHTVSHEVRDLHAQKRDINREQSIEQEIEESSFVLDRFLVDSQPSPGQQAWHHERNLALANALELLPTSQRTVIVMKYWHEMSLRQIAESLNQPIATIAALMHSSTKSLKSSLRNIQ